MASEVGKLQLVLGADASRFIAAMQEAQAKSAAFKTDTERHFAGVGAAAEKMGGVVKTAVTAFAGVGVAAAGAAAVLGAKTNIEFENASAKIQAFTKDAGKTQGILEGIRKEAAATPFAFNEMANATASLMPVAKSSGAALMDLVRQAEILAASHPEQGLQGAAVALREATGGDFTSIVERFDLPRQRLNQLKEQGVPALKAVSMAMQEMGYDSDLVSNLANTASGRWSTFMDTISTLAGKLTKPIFTTLTQGLGGLQQWLDDNNGKLETFADLLGNGILAFATGGGFDKFYDGMVKALGPERAADIARLLDPLANVRSAISDLAAGDVMAAWEKLQKAAQETKDIIADALSNIIQYVQAHLPDWVGTLKTWGDAAAQWVKDATPVLMDNLNHMFTDLLTWVRDHGPDVAEAFGDWSVKATAWVAEAAVKTALELPQINNRIAKFVLEHWHEVYEATKKIGEGYVKGIIAGMGDVAQQLWDAISGPLGAVIERVKNAIANALASGAFAGPLPGEEGGTRYHVQSYMGGVAGLMPTSPISGHLDVINRAATGSYKSVLEANPNMVSVSLNVDGRQMGAATTGPLMRDSSTLMRTGAA